MIFLSGIASPQRSECLGPIAGGLAMLSVADHPATIDMYNDLKREHLMRAGSVVLHGRYFVNLGGNCKAPA